MLVESLLELGISVLNSIIFRPGGTGDAKVWAFFYDYQSRLVEIMPQELYLKLSQMKKVINKYYGSLGRKISLLKVIIDLQP